MGLLMVWMALHLFCANDKNVAISPVNAFTGATLSLSQARMKTLRELFDESLTFSGRARVEFFDAHCPDAAMRATLEALLASDTTGDTDDSAAHDVVALSRAIGEVKSGQLAPGSSLGPFTIDTHIGEGGSSSIYRAHRDIENVRQTVALKILRRSMHAPEARRQFDRERRALSALQHPFIAQLIDGGIAADGTAFLAIELVAGLPITEYARQKSLSFRARLQLFEQVARAVAAAHRALIVHRDLKPGNVMVTHDGHVKLLDFGIAKLLAETGDETQTAFQAFTPAYAAPEQRERGQITTATDVYALGILLGELLTGQRVTDGQHRTPSLCITEDTAEGTLPATPSQTRKLLRGDLDNIVLKALELEPGRRYASAGEFADDIERLLSGLPVKAHPPSRWYRAAKFVRRNRASVALVSLLTIGLIATTGTALWQAQQARLQSAKVQLESQRATRQAKRAEQMSAFLGSIFSGVQPVQRDGTPPSLSTLVKRAALKAQAGLSDDPEAAVNLLVASGKIFDDLSDAENEKSMYQEAIKRAEQSLPISNDERLFAISALAEFFRFQGNLDDAEQLLKSTAAALPAGGIASKGHAVFILTYSKLERTRGRMPEALQRSNNAVRECEAQFGPTSYELMDALNQRSITLRDGGNLDAAAVDMERAYAISKTEACANSDCGPVVAATYADLLLRQGKYAQGREIHLQAAEIIRRAYPDPNVEYSYSLSSLAVSYGYEQLWAPSEQLLRAALAIQQTATDLEDGGTDVVQQSLGRVLTAQDKPQEAAALLQMVLARQRNALDAQSPMLASTLNFLASAESKSGQHEAAQTHALEALEILEAVNGENNVRTAGAITTLAEIAERQGNLSEALTLSQRALNSAMAAQPGGGQATWPARTAHARIACASKQPDAAAEFGKIWAEISAHPNPLPATELYLLDQAAPCMAGDADLELAKRMAARQKLLRADVGQRITVELQKTRTWLAQMDTIKPKRD